MIADAIEKYDLKNAQQQREMHEENRNRAVVTDAKLDRLLVAQQIEQGRKMERQVWSKPVYAAATAAAAAAGTGLVEVIRWKLGL